MKILLLSAFYSPTVSGGCRVLQDVVDHLHAEGHQVEVLTYGLDPQRGYLAFDGAQPYAIYRILPRRPNGASSVAMFIRLLSLCLRRRYDLVLCGVGYPSAILAYLARWITGVPYAIYSHGEDITMVKGSLAKTALLARALRGARVIMANSSYTGGEIAALGVPGERIERVPPWLDAAPFGRVSPAAVDALRTRLGLHGKRVILTVARLSARKGHDTIIRALPAVRERIPNAHYVVLGKGDPEHLRALAESEGAAAQVSFLEYLPQAELPALYHACDVYAMVSRWDPNERQVDGFGIVYLEAAACGKPAVAGLDGGCRDAVEAGVTGLVVDPSSVAETAAALTALLGSPERAAAMGAAGKQRVHEQFERRRTLERLTRIVQRATWTGLPRRGLSPG